MTLLLRVDCRTTTSTRTARSGCATRPGNNISHGSVYDKPFAWRAVSAVAASGALGGPGRKATLYAYQPRKGVDPANWSGQQLGAASAYSSTTVPVAQQTDRDPALSDYLNNFPPQWDRLVELRIYFGALHTPVSASAYPAADIRIAGTTWTLLNGAKVDLQRRRARHIGRGRDPLVQHDGAAATSAPLGGRCEGRRCSGAGAEWVALRRCSRAGGLTVPLQRKHSDVALIAGDYRRGRRGRNGCWRLVLATVTWWRGGT